MAGDRTVKITILGDDRSGSSALQKLGGVAGQVEAKISGLGSGLGVLGVAAGTALGGAILSGVGHLASLGASAVKTGFDFNSMYQQADIAFTTMLGSAQKSKTFLDDLASFAASTPFEFPDLVSASQKMLAMGFSANQVIPTLTSIGNAVAGMGGNAAMVDRVTVAFGQMNAKGKASAEEIMQLTEAGIPAWKYLAEAIGVDIPTAMDMVSKGTISSGQAIAAFTKGMDRDFGGMMDRQSKTWAGLMSTLSDISSQASGKIMAPIFAAMSDGLSKVVTALSGPAFNTFIATLATGMGTLVANTERAFGMIGRTAGQIGTIFSTTVAPALDALGQAFGRTGSESNLAQSKMAGFQRALDTIVRVVAAGAQGFQSLVGGIITVKGAFDQLRGVLSTGDFAGGVLSEDSPLVTGAFAIRDAIQQLAPVFDFLRDHLTQVSLAVGPVISVLMGISPPLALLMGAVKLLAVAWINDWGGIRETTMGAVEGISGFITGTLLPAFEQASTFVTTTLWPAMQSAWAQIQTGVGAAIDAILPVLQRFGDWFTTNLLPALQNLGATIGPALATMLPGLQAFGDGLIALGAAVLPVIAPIASAIIDTLGPAIVQLADWGATVIPQFAAAFSTIMTVIGGALSTIAGFVSSHSEQITALLTGAWTIISNIIGANIAVIQGVISATLQVINGDWSGAWQTVQNTATTVWNSIKTVVSTAMGLLHNGIETTLGLILTALSNGWNMMKTTAETAWESLRSAVATKIDAVVTLAQGLPGKITGAIGNLGTLLFNAGSSLIQGLLDGISSKIGELKNLLGGITNMLPSWKGPESVDRKILFGSGQMVMDGFARGLADGAGDVRDTLAGITAGLGVGAIGAPAFAGLGAAGGRMSIDHRVTIALDGGVGGVISASNPGLDELAEHVAGMILRAAGQAA